MIDFDPDDTAQPGPPPGPIHRREETICEHLRDVGSASTVEIARHFGISASSAYHRCVNLWPDVRHVGTTKVRGQYVNVWGTQ